MSRASFDRYKPYPAVDLADRTWPGRVLEHAPLWCSVDLRDGNQALIEPMGFDRKLRMFELLVRMGFKEIEVGFPAASSTELEFVRRLILEKRIPDDVTIQVLTQARDELIRTTMESVRGARRAIVHLYNSTSTLQRRVVFGLPEAGIVDIAVNGTRLIKELAKGMPETEIVLEYSPESFTGTELPFAKEICEAVMDAWGPTPASKVIINLPATVEMATPNVYADQIEWFGRNVKNRELIVLSVHPHNDRGTAVAAAELAMMAGADRVEGTLFGNGERTGNVDVVTIALNLLTQGIDPELEIDDIDAIAAIVRDCNRLPIHPRHPYVGELVFTAFSGSHQDAIKKGLVAQKAAGVSTWEVPYLPIDPADLGRSYEAIIRINSQSGKGGLSYVMEENHGFRLPRKLAIEFSQSVQKAAAETGLELSSDEIWSAFNDEYLSGKGRFALDGSASVTSTEGSACRVTGKLVDAGATASISGVGNGPISAFIAAVGAALGAPIVVSDYSEHSLGEGAEASAVAYVEVRAGGHSTFGVGVHPSIVTASLDAVLSALNRLERRFDSAFVATHSDMPSRASISP
ncbi:MAG TPA: 2-isopropylmalate synthase [Polyangiaceae bacterium]|jgi:2-isopropylmalate synthase|nr:2-isopropylmalate synthase [Polyangiaceae bacterium]